MSSDKTGLFYLDGSKTGKNSSVLLMKQKGRESGDEGEEVREGVRFFFYHRRQIFDIINANQNIYKKITTQLVFISEPSWIYLKF